MISLIAENERGDRIDFSKNKDYTIYKVDGITPVEATIASTANSTADGATINRRSIGYRNIVIYMTINGEIEENRLKLYRYFPVKKDVQLHFETDSRDVLINGAVELISCDIFSAREAAQISIICPQPYFRAVNDLVSYLSDTEALFEFPFSIDKNGIEISRIERNIRKSIINTGETETGIIIQLYATGEVVNPIIYDVDEKTYLKLNYTMQQDDEIVINTNTGQKEIKLIRAGVETNIMGHLSPGSTWLQVEQGDNVFTYNCDSGNSDLRITFITQQLYGGL